MDLITFWKNYGRDLEGLLDKAHKREVIRLQEVIKQENHYVMQDEMRALEDMKNLKMIRSIVIEINSTKNL